VNKTLAAFWVTLAMLATLWDDIQLNTREFNVTNDVAGNRGQGESLVHPYTRESVFL
jgi:hypothetical protein